jgi:hypothetical protein
MRKRNIHTVPSGGKWSVKEENRPKPIAEVDTKREAEQIGREIAKQRGVDHIIHDREGKIQARESYGNDPCPPKDKEH